MVMQLEVLTISKIHNTPRGDDSSKVGSLSVRYSAIEIGGTR
jgi:hypothetical protein